MAAVVAPALVVVPVAVEAAAAAAAVEEAAVCAGSSVSGFGIEVAVLGTGPVATLRRCSASLARHSVVFEELIPAPCRPGSRLAAAVAAVGLAGLVGPAAVPVAAVAVVFAASFEGSGAYRPDSSESPACLLPSCSSAQSSEGRPTRKRLDRKGYRGIAVEMLPLCALR